MGAWLCCIGTGHESGIDMGGDDDGMGMFAEGGCAKEEDGGCWLINGVSIFRRRTSSLAAIEAWVAAKWAMAASSRSRTGFQWPGSVIGTQ